MLLVSDTNRFDRNRALKVKKVKMGIQDIRSSSVTSFN